MGSPSHPASLSIWGALRPSSGQFPALMLLGSGVDLVTPGQYHKFTVIPVWELTPSLLAPAADGRDLREYFNLKSSSTEMSGMGDRAASGIFIVRG